MWTRSTVARAEAHTVLEGAQAVSISADLDVAVSILSSLRQAGLGYGAPTVIAIIGIDMATALSVPTSPASLQSSTVVVDDFPSVPDDSTFAVFEVLPWLTIRSRRPSRPLSMVRGHRHR